MDSFYDAHASDAYISTRLQMNAFDARAGFASICLVLGDWGCDLHLVKSFRFPRTRTLILFLMLFGTLKHHDKCLNEFSKFFRLENSLNLNALPLVVAHFTTKANKFASCECRSPQKNRCWT
jgi:hypothetical protein